MPSHSFFVKPVPSAKESHHPTPGLLRTAVSRARSVCVALMLGGALAGCAVGPDYVGPPKPDLPSHWSARTASRRDAGKLDRWWLRLRDPLLNRLIEEAVQANPDVAKAKAVVREARATLQQTTAGLFPSVSGTAALTNNKTSASSSSVLVDSAPYTLHQASFDSSWELDLFGGTQRSIEAALHGEQSAEEDLRDSLVTLIGDVAAYYVEARGYQARIALAQRTSVSQRDTEKLTRGKYEAGSGNAVDLAKATAQAASTEANVPTYQAALAADVHRLGILLGRPPDGVASLLARSAAVPAPRMPLPTGLPADLSRAVPTSRAPSASWRRPPPRSARPKRTATPRCR
jgi:outer membrane protein, multidrug efflux system